MRGKEEKMRKTAFAAVLAGTGLAACAETVPGTNEVAVLPPVVVYASRVESTAESMPAAVQVFGADDIAASGARDLAELLQRKAGVDVHSMNGNPVLTSIAMRGFGDNAFGRTKVVLDGEELNNVDMNAPNLTRIPLGAVERVEVIHGPSPVLYGDGAVAGVVNVSSDSRDYSRRTKLYAKAGSQNTYGAGAQTRGGFEDEGWLYNASYDNLRSGGYRDRSAYELHTANAGLRKVFENGSTVGFRANYQNAFYELPGSLTREQWACTRRCANNDHDWTRQWSYGFALDSKLRLAAGQWLYLDGSFSHQRRRAKMTAWGTDTEYDYYSYALSPRYVNENEVLGFGNKFTAGFDFRFDGYREKPKDGDSRRFRRDRYAFFLHDEFAVTETLSLTAGGRLERIGNRWKGYSGLAEDHSRDVMGDYELGVVFRPVEGLKTYVKGTRFHRSAFCDELSYTKDGDFLRPETGWSLDVGAEWEFAEEFRLDVNGYGMLMEDEIFFDPALAPYGYNCNSPAKTRRLGVDAGISWRRDKVAEASLRYGFVDAEFSGGEYGGREVPFVPAHRARAEAGVWIFADLEVKGGCTFTGRQYVSGDFANDCDKLASYTLFDVGVHYSPSWAEGWKAAFTVDNLLDRDYCDYAGVGYYYPACGRSFLFTLSCEF